MKSRLNKMERKVTISRLVFLGMVLIFAFLLLCILAKMYIFGTGTNNYLSWPVSEWLINYEGGFVRRGLCGQLLYWLYQLHPYPVRDAIALISFAGLVTFLYIVLKIFIKEGWSVFILVTPFLIMIPVLGGGEWFWLRRDHWLLLTACASFYSYAVYMKNKGIRYLFLFWILTILAPLMHEAAFFFIIPLLMLHHYCAELQNEKTWLQTTAHASFVFTPSILAMAIVCLFKGDKQIANAIWTSWYPCMNNYPLPSEHHGCVGAGVKALTWETWPTIKMHLKCNFLAYYYWRIPAFPFDVLKVAGAYYLATRINTVNLKWNALNTVNNVGLSNILILQFICLLPLFTILSCDSARIMSYWIFSALFAYHYLKADERVFPAKLAGISSRIQTKISKSRILTHPFFYILVVLLLPVSPCSTYLLSFWRMFLGNLLQAILKIAEHIS